MEGKCGVRGEKKEKIKYKKKGGRGMVVRMKRENEGVGAW